MPTILVDDFGRATDCNCVITVDNGLLFAMLFGCMNHEDLAMSETNPEIMALTTQIVSAHVSHNNVPASAVPELIRSVYASLSGASKSTGLAVVAEPAVSIKSSVRADKITCLDCGKVFSMLKRHLMTDHKLTPQEYRRKWELPASYPMVAPNYAKVRSGLAKKIGLGRKPMSRKAVAKRPVGRPRKMA
jgi:predicted transcriptional regulator